MPEYTYCCFSLLLLSSLYAFSFSTMKTLLLIFRCFCAGAREIREREQHAPYMHSNGNRGKNYVSKRYYYRVVERICFSLASYYTIHKIGPGHFSLLRRKGAFLAVKLVISRKQHRPNLKVGI